MDAKLILKCQLDLEECLKVLKSYQRKYTTTLPSRLLSGFGYFWHVLAIEQTEPSPLAIATESVS